MPKTKRAAVKEAAARFVQQGANVGKRRGILLELDYDGTRIRKITKLMFQHGKGEQS